MPATEEPAFSASRAMAACPTCDHLVDHEPDQAEVHFI
jgi:hypothetical protein